MTQIKKKLLSIFLIMAVFITAVPVYADNAEAPATITTEDDIIAAINAIPDGGTGVINLKDVDLTLNESIFFENKTITFNLENTKLTTAVGEYGASPVILALDANVTINADEKSSIKTVADTYGGGVVRVENCTYDDASGSFTKECSLTVKGGTYGAVEGDYTFAVSSGTNALLDGVYCDGTVEAFAGAGLDFYGDIVINSGRFSNDVADYATDGTYVSYAGDYCYVRETEMSDEFAEILTDGKLVLNYAKPSSAEDSSVWIAVEDMSVAHPGFSLLPDSFSDDFNKISIILNERTLQEEGHEVDVVWNYDEEVVASAKTFIDRFPEDRPWFRVMDLELINYWVNRDADSEVGSLANYSGELKECLDNTNFIFEVEVRGGGDEPFFTERIATAKLIHDGIVYFTSGRMGAKAEHAIYVPESTADTKEALIAAAQKRIDDYIGEDIIKITAADSTVTEYYNTTLSDCDAEIADATQRLNAANAILDAELAKVDSNLIDWDLVSANQLIKQECEMILNSTPGYKDYFIEQFEEGGDYYFLKSAAGDYFFNVAMNGEDMGVQFVIIKDDDKLITPSCETVDLKTNVGVYTDSSSIPLDTTINVKKLTDGADYDKIMNILKVKDNVTFDITLHSGSIMDNITKLADGSFEVSIPIPEALKGKTLTAYYVDKDGKTVPYTGTPENGYAKFSTDHFSIYTLAETIVEDSDDNTDVKPDDGITGDPDAGDNNTSAITLAVLVLCVMLSAGAILTKRVRKYTE